jgi:hypothetical protein
MSTNPALVCYAQPFADYGYDNLALLQGADEEGLTEAFSQLQVKAPHRKAIKEAWKALQQVN